MTITEAQLEASITKITNHNEISREEAGNAIICFVAVASTVHTGDGADLPDSLAEIEGSLTSRYEGGTMRFQIDTRHFLLLAPFLFREEHLPEVNRLMKTVDGKAELVKTMFNKLFTFGTVKDRSCSTFQHGNDNSVQRDLYLKAVRDDLCLCFFNDGITMEHLMNPSTLTRSAENGGAPVTNSVNRKKNKEYEAQQKPGFYFGNSTKKLSQNAALKELGVQNKSGPINQQLGALRRGWEAQPQGSKSAVRDTIKRRRVTYK